MVLRPDAIECPLCGRRFNLVTAGHYRTHGFKDAASFKKATGLETLQAPSLNRRAAERMAEGSPTLGRRRTAEEIVLMCERRKGKGQGVAGKYKRTPEIRDKISKGVMQYHRTQNFRKGHWMFLPKAGGRVFVRSSWEARVAALLQKSSEVSRFEVEPCVIPYFYRGGRHRYTPDFKVVGRCQITELWEIKPSKLIGHPKNKAKMAALNAYVDAQDMNARLVTLQDIERMEAKVCPLPTWEDMVLSNDRSRAS